MRLLSLLFFLLLLNSCTDELHSTQEDFVTGAFPDIIISDELNLYTDHRGNPMNGHKTAYHEDGELHAELAFEDGMIISGGFFAPDGRQYILFEHKDDLYVQTMYQESGIKQMKNAYGENLNDRQLFKTWFENGRMMVKSNQDVHKMWHENGQLAGKSPLVNGRMEGKSIAWHENGMVAGEGYYKDDRPHGKHQQWDENGALIQQRMYENGMPHGINKKWDLYGNLLEEKMYKNGKPHGTHKAWDAEGNLVNEMEFEEGTVVSAL